MYVIKMERDKSLVCTVRADVYQGEKRADTLVFVVPKSYDNVSLSECTMLMRYILPNGVGESVELSLCPTPYNDNYLQYKLIISSKFTRFPGDITLWLTARNLDDDVVLKSGEIVIDVTPAKQIDDYLPDDGTSEYVSEIDILAERIDKLQEEKADNITYNEDTCELQLLSGNELIGNVSIVPSENYIDQIKDDVGNVWSDIKSSEEESADYWEQI